MNISGDCIVITSKECTMSDNDCHIIKELVSNGEQVVVNNDEHNEQLVDEHVESVTTRDHQSDGDLKLDSTNGKALDETREVMETPIGDIKKSMSEMESKINNLRISEKWGESVGIYDDNGEQRRVVDLMEVNNYMKLELTLNESDYDFYLALISPRYPRFLRSTPHYNQRWRMRYNVFIGSVFEDRPDSVLHIGEIHLYSDIIARFVHPFYVNSSLYMNKNDCEVSDTVLTKIEQTLNAIRFSKDIHQLKFPLTEDLFSNRNSIFDKFMERQTEFDEEAQTIHYKHLDRIKKYGYWRKQRSEPRMRRNGYDSRDQYNRHSDNENDVTFEDSKERGNESKSNRYEKGYRRYNTGKPFNANRRFFSNKKFDSNRNYRTEDEDDGQNGYKSGSFSLNDEQKYSKFNRNKSRYTRNRSKSRSFNVGDNSNLYSFKKGERDEDYGRPPWKGRSDRYVKRDEESDGNRDQFYAGKRAYSHRYRKTSYRDNGYEK